MFDSKLVDMLQKMPKKLFKQLGLMVVSPYFNKKPDLILFYQFFEKYYPRFVEKKITYEKCHDFVYPQKKFNKKEIGYLMTDLVRIIESLLTEEKMKSKTGLENILLMEALLDLGLDKPFNQVLRSAYSALEDHPYRDPPYHYSKYQLYAQENAYFADSQKYQYDESLQRAVNELDLFYLTQKMHLACEMLNRQNVVNADYDYLLIEEIQAFFIKNPELVKANPGIAIHNLIFKGFKDPDTDVELFDELLQLLHEHAELFPPEEAKGMYFHTINFCARKIHAGKKYFINKVFELYKSILTKNLILAEGHITPWTYMNIVTVGIRSNELTWTEEFIEEYKNKLRPEFKENAYHYNLAYLYFNQQQYEKAIDQLNQVVFDNVYYSCESRSLLLRIYYAKEEFEAFYSLIDSFRVYLRRNKLITDKKKTMYQNLIKFVNRLSKLVKGDNEALEFLEQQIKDTKLIINEEWLMDQVRLKKK